MNSRKIKALFIVGFGYVLFNGFTLKPVKTDVVNNENKNNLTGLVVLNENAPIELTYGDQNPVATLLDVVDVNIKAKHEQINYVGIDELHKQKYIAGNKEIYISGYDAKKLDLKEIQMEVKTINSGLEEDEKKSYRVLVHIVDKSAPEITLTKEETEITVGDEFDITEYIESIEDNEDGTIEDYQIKDEDVNLEEAGEYTYKIIAKDKSNNEVEKEFKLIVKEKEQEEVVAPREEAQATTSVQPTTTQSYTYAVGGDFGAIDTNYVASLNGGAPGYCTWYVYNRLAQLGAPIPHRVMGNGGQWADYARSYGYSVSKEAKAGRVASFRGGYGHVAFVEKVNSDGSVLLSEMNYGGGRFVISSRTLSASQAANAEYIDFGL